MLVSTWFDRSDPQRPMFNPTTEGLLRSRQLKSFSRDAGVTWSAWEEVPTYHLTGCAVSGPILRWVNGRIGVSIESFKEYDDARRISQASWILASNDGGRTFEEPVQMTCCPTGEIYYWDQRLCVGREPGDFVGLYWTHDRTQRKDISVHCCHGRLSDGRLSRFELWETTIPGQIGAPLVLPDGRWLAAVVDRRRPATIRIWASNDNGRSWPVEHSLVIHAHEELAMVTQGAQDIDLAKYWEDFGKWSFGHPALRMLGSRHVLLAYYAGDPNCMSGHWIRLRVC